LAQLNLKLPDAEMENLRAYARRRRTPVAWLIKDYVEYLLRGGQPVSVQAPDVPTGIELAAFAERSGAFDWLADEPDIYTLEDGEPL